MLAYPKHNVIRAGSQNESYFGETLTDIRDSKEFKAFRKEVGEFINAEKSVTWRQLNNRFPDQHYWLSLAIESLDGEREFHWDKDRIPERIFAL